MLLLDANSAPILLSREAWENDSRSIPRLLHPFSSPQEIAQALLKNPGRFRSPLSLLEKLKLKLYAASEPLDFFNLFKNFFFVSQKQFIPYEWQVLLRYLSREGILERPEAVLSRFGHDYPKDIALSLYESTSKKKSVGYGDSGDIQISISKAVGELLERFFFAQTTDALQSSAKHLKQSGKVFLHPDALSHFSEEQKKNSSRLRFQEDEIISWVKGKEVLTNKEILLPSQSIFRSHILSSGETILRDPNSNGCAGHFTLHEAVLAGIYENTERDGFLIYWLNSIAPPVIDLESIQNEELQNLITEFRRYRFEVQFLNTTTDTGIPSFLCVLIDRSTKGPRVAVGGGCGLNIYSALLGGAREASSVYNSFKSEPLSPSLPEHYEAFSDRRIGRDKRILLWQNPEMFPKIEPFLSGKKQRLEEAFPSLPTFKNTKEEYEYITEIFRKRGKGYEIYMYETKHRVLDTIGYHAVKVVIPEMIHLYLNESLPPLGATRLKVAPERLGYTSAQEWNKWPHPFP